MFEPKLGRRMSWLAWRFAGRRVITESSLQRTNRTRLAGERRSANRAGPSAIRFHGPPARLSFGFIRSLFANVYILTRRNGTLELWNFLSLIDYCSLSDRCPTSMFERDRSVTGAFITGIDVLDRPVFPVRYCRLINTGFRRSRKREKHRSGFANSGCGQGPQRQIYVIS